MLDSQTLQVFGTFALAKDIALDKLPTGAGSRIHAIEGEGRVARELLTLGLVPGVRVRVLRRGLGGDPLEISAGGHPLCLRREQSRIVRVSVVPTAG